MRGRAWLVWRSGWGSTTVVLWRLRRFLMGLGLWSRGCVRRRFSVPLWVSRRRRACSSISTRRRSGSSPWSLRRFLRRARRSSITSCSEFLETREARRFIGEGGVEYAREVLSRAYGARQAEEILSRTVNTGPLEFLRGHDPETIALVLSGEMPQTVALVLAHLPTLQLAGAILERLSPELQVEVAIRISLRGQTVADLIAEIAAVIKKRLSQTRIDTRALLAHGIPRLAEILGAADRTTGRQILEQLDESDPSVAEAVRSLLFVFEDLLRLDDRSLQLVLREIDQKDVALALLGTSEKLQERVFANMSARATASVQEEMSFLRPQRRRTVDEAQTKFIATVRKLEEADAIVIPAATAANTELV